jgi:hypothetical protein
MSEKKYVLANIKIPIEITESDDYEPLTEYMSIKFENIDSLPEKLENDYDSDYIKNQIYELLQKPIRNTNVENQLTIHMHEIKHKTKNKKNITFRNKNHSTSRYSRKEFYDK